MNTCIDEIYEIIACRLITPWLVQWRSYTWARMGPGPGEFLSALVNHVRSTYLNCNSIAVYGIVMENKAAIARF